MHLRTRQAERVLRIGLAERVGNQRKFSTANRQRELGIELITRGRAVRAEAIGFEARNIGDIIEHVFLPAELQAVFARAETAGVEGATDRWCGRAIGGKDLHHTAG